MNYSKTYSVWMALLIGFATAKCTALPITAIEKQLPQLNVNGLTPHMTCPSSALDIQRDDCHPQYPTVSDLYGASQKNNPIVVGITGLLFKSWKSQSSTELSKAVGTSLSLSVEATIKQIINLNNAKDSGIYRALSSKQINDLKSFARNQETKIQQSQAADATASFAYKTTIRTTSGSTTNISSDGFNFVPTYYRLYGIPHDTWLIVNNTLSQQEKDSCWL